MFESFNKYKLWVFSSFFVVLLLFVTGFSYRFFKNKLKRITQKKIELPVPLSSFPYQIDNWEGKDVPIPNKILRVAKNDDFLNRLYVNHVKNEGVNIYVAYSARPRMMRGHRPTVCYKSAGWIHDSTQTIELTLSSGKNIHCLIHHFHLPNVTKEKIVVLHYYIINGEIVLSEKGFSGLGWRTPNIKGDPARYVAQVQISSTLENAVINAATDMTDIVISFFP